VVVRKLFVGRELKEEGIFGEWEQNFVFPNQFLIFFFALSGTDYACSAGSTGAFSEEERREQQWQRVFSYRIEFIAQNFQLFCCFFSEHSFLFQI
jgi:hypothetical protein